MMNLKKCFPAGLRRILYVYLGPVSKGVCQKKKKKKRRTIEKKKKSFIDTYCVKYIRKQEKSVFLM